MNARLQFSTPAVAEVRAIGLTQQREMYALYERYYEGSSFEVFQRDLLAKDRVVLLRDEDGELCGFSTLAMYARQFEGAPLRVVFSGDTIVDERCWGSSRRSPSLAALRRRGSKRRHRRRRCTGC